LLFFALKCLFNRPAFCSIAAATAAASRSDLSLTAALSVVCAQFPADEAALDEPNFFKRLPEPEWLQRALLGVCVLSITTFYKRSFFTELQHWTLYQLGREVPTT